MLDKLMRLDTVVLVKLYVIIYVSEVVPPVIIKLYVIYQVIAVEDVCLSHCLFMSVPVTDAVVFACFVIGYKRSHSSPQYTAYTVATPLGSRAGTKVNLLQFMSQFLSCLFRLESRQRNKNLLKLPLDEATIVRPLAVDGSKPLTQREAARQTGLLPPLSSHGM